MESDRANAVSLIKDTIIFNKRVNYSKSNAVICEQITFNSNIIKFKVYGEKISEFLAGDEQTLDKTLKSQLSKNDME